MKIHRSCRNELKELLIRTKQVLTTESHEKQDTRMKLTLSFNSVSNEASTLLSLDCSLEDADSSSNIFRAWKIMQAL